MEIKMLNHNGTKTIKTERLTLRRFEIGDADAMFNNWANDPEVTKFLTWTPHGSVELTKQLLGAWCASYESDNYYNWAIEFEGEIIGNISVVQVSDKHEKAVLGYCMGKKWWGRGIMTEAARAIIGYLFETIGFHRIEIWHAVKNPASGAVARKCGCTLEGVKRQEFKSVWGEFLDIAEYAILRDEWGI